MKISKIFASVIFTIFPICNAFAYTDRSLVSYVTGNIIWRVIMEGGYYSLGILGVLAILALIFKSFRTTILSLFMALCALFLFVLMYEVVQEMGWVDTMPGYKPN